MIKTLSPSGIQPSQAEERRRAIYRFVYQTLFATGLVPTIPEIQNALQLPAKSNVHYHLTYLEAQNVLIRRPGSCRIRCIPDVSTASHQDNTSAGFLLLSTELGNGVLGVQLQVQTDAYRCIHIVPGDVLVLEQRDPKAIGLVLALHDPVHQMEPHLTLVQVAKQQQSKEEDVPFIQSVERQHIISAQEWEQDWVALGNVVNVVRLL